MKTFKTAFLCLLFPVLAFGNVKHADLSGVACQDDCDVWAAYEGFNNVMLDKDKYIYRTNSSFARAEDRWNGAAAIWCQPIFWDMAMNAYKLAERKNDTKRCRVQSIVPQNF